jgi:LuxR family maltose regulon positive regulatory protein
MERRLAKMNRLDQVNIYRLILIVGPDKSGKTERVKGWISQHSRERRMEVAWLTLEEADNQPERFLGDLYQMQCTVLPPTLTQADQSIRIFSTAATGSPGNQALEASLAGWINALAQVPGKLILVLDKYEAISSSVIHQAVSLLLDYLPPQVVVVIISTCEPPLPLARMRVRRQLLEISAAELK